MATKPGENMRIAGGLALMFGVLIGITGYSMGENMPIMFAGFGLGALGVLTFAIGAKRDTRG